MPFCATPTAVSAETLSRDSIGGHPFLPAGMPTHDGQRMAPELEGFPLARHGVQEHEGASAKHAVVRVSTTRSIST